MFRISKGTLALAAAVTLVFSGAATAAPQGQEAQAQTQPTPKGWNYKMVNGQREPKGNRVTNADGSWREEIHQGKCTTVKEKSAAGQYKESRSCD